MRGGHRIGYRCAWLAVLSQFSRDESFIRASWFSAPNRVARFCGWRRITARGDAVLRSCSPIFERGARIRCEQVSRAPDHVCYQKLIRKSISLLQSEPSAWSAARRMPGAAKIAARIERRRAADGQPWLSGTDQ
jgi:hypothetical protein